MHYDPATWGTYGQWASSALTVASLFLGLRILRIDQRDKRRAQAAKVTFTAVLSVDMETEFLSAVRGHVYNDSDALITSVAIRVDFTDDVVNTLAWKRRFTDPIHRMAGYQSLSDGHNQTNNLMPGRNAACTVEIPRRIRIQKEHVVVSLIFTDANNVTWQRPLNRPVHEFRYWGRMRRGAVRAVLAWTRTTNRIKRRKTPN